MAINLTLPQVNGNNKSTKDKIVLILSQEFPLTAKEISHRLKKEHSTNLSYSAVHKLLNQLVEEQIVLREEKKYSLNREWITKVKKFGSNLEDSYLKKNIFKPNDLKNGFGNFELNSIHESDIFLLDFILDHLSKKKEVMAWQWSHYWIPLFLSMKEYQKIGGIQEGFDVYSIVKGKSLIDKWCSDFWEKQGAKTKFGVNIKSDVNIVAFEDFVIQVFYPPETLLKLNKFFNKIKKIEDIDINKLFQDIFLEKTKILMVINKNQPLAERIKKETIEHFEGEKK